MASLENEFRFAAHVRDGLRVVSRHPGAVPPLVAAYRDFNRERQTLSAFLEARGIAYPPGTVFTLNDPRLAEWSQAPQVRGYMKSIESYLAAENSFRRDATAYAAAAGLLDPQTDSTRLNDIISEELAAMRTREDTPQSPRRPGPAAGPAHTPK